jgi:Ca-activated chloride channel family protein
LDDYMIVGFNKKVQLISDWNSSRNDILKALSGVFKYKPNGQTALYDAIYLSLKKMPSSPHPKHILLIVSDGEDDSSEVTLRQIRSALRESDVMVYILGMEGTTSGVGRNTLEDLASVSGGLALFPRSETEMNDMCAQVAEELRHQYVIGISPTKTVLKDKWHSVSIKLTAPKVDPPAKFPRVYVRSRDGYYLP